MGYLVLDYQWLSPNLENYQNPYVDVENDRILSFSDLTCNSSLHTLHVMPSCLSNASKMCYEMFGVLQQ